VHSLATQPLAVKAMMPPVAQAARSVETLLQKLLREKTGGAV
jgi:hypothetical protein